MTGCYCDYDMPEVHEITTPMARKEHRCTECGTTIMPKEKYERVFGVWDGDAQVYKTCPLCLGLREYVQAHVPCFCWAYSNMREDAKETCDMYSSEAPGLMFGFYRREINIQRSRANG